MTVTRFWNLGLAVALIVFVFSRVWLVGYFVPAKSDTVAVYIRYAAEKDAADQDRVSPYEYHRIVTAAMRRQGVNPLLIPRDEVEYPPLAMSLLYAARSLSSTPPLQNRHDKIESRAYSVTMDKAYPRAYRRLMAVFDVGSVLLLFWILWRTGILGARADQHARVRAFAVALLGYTLSTSCMFYVLYDRLDIVLMFSLLLAIALLVSKLPAIFAHTAFALSINFKLVPLVLLPVWLIGSLPCTAWRGAADWRGFLRPWRHYLGTAVIVGVISVAILAPYLQSYGWDALGFLAYHSGRGLQLESVGASLLMLERLIGLPLVVALEYGSMHLRATGAAFLCQLSPLLVAIGMIWIAWRFGRQVPTPEPPAKQKSKPRQVGRSRLAQQHGQAFVAAMLAGLLVSICTSKVLSPQYLLWVLPSSALLGGLRCRRGYWVAAGAVVTAAATYFVFPRYYDSDLVGGGSPTNFGIALLLVRNALLIAWTVVAVQSMKPRLSTQPPA